jgi:hypothetical protein
MRRLDEISRRLKRAVPGPWRMHDFGVAGDQEPSSVVVHTGKFNWDAIYYGPDSDAALDWDGEVIVRMDVEQHETAELIAKAPEDLADLVSVLQEIEAANSRYMAGETSGLTLSIDVHAALQRLTEDEDWD